MKRFLCIAVVLCMVMTAFTVGGVPLKLEVDILSPADNTLFHERQVSIYVRAEACCGDEIETYGWTWQWSNGSKEETFTLNEDVTLYFYFYINVTLRPGKNVFTASVSTNTGKEASDTITLQYDGPAADAHGPYEGRVDVPVRFRGSTPSGKPPFSMEWDFGDGHTATGPSPSHTYSQIGIYQITFTITDNRGYSDTNVTSATIDEADHHPPTVAITCPTKSFYLNGKELMPFFLPLIIGDVTVEAVANDDDTWVNSVAFYLDGQLKYNDTAAPYQWDLDSPIGIHSVKAICYDDGLNTAIDTIRLIVIS